MLWKAASPSDSINRAERTPLITRDILNLPNALTISRICLTPVFLVLLFEEDWYLRSLAVVVFSVASLTDLYDGRIARTRNSVTEFGRFMDPLADKILVTSALIALVVCRLVHFWLVVPIVARDILITGMRMHGAYHGRQMETSRLAKWKTTVQMFAIGFLLVGDGGPDTVPVVAIGNGLLWLAAVLSLITGYDYLRVGLRHILDQDPRAGSGAGE